MRAMLALFICVAASEPVLGQFFCRTMVQSPPAHHAPIPGYVGFDPRELNLQEHPWSTGVPFELKFVNDSSDDLVISVVRPSCGCTAMSPDQYVGAVVKAKTSLKLAGILETGSKVGAFQRPVELQLRDGRTYATSIVYRVFSTYQVTPSSLQFGDVPWAERGGASRSIRILSSPPLKVLDLEMDVPWLRVALREHQDGGIELPCSLDPATVPTGEVHGRITVVTNDPYQPRMTIPVSALLRAPFRAVPAQVVLRKGETRKVRVFDAANGEPASVKLAEPCPEQVTVRTIARGVFEVTLHDSLQRGQSISVTLKSESGEEVVIPVSESF